MTQAVTPSWDPRVSGRKEERGVPVRERGRNGLWATFGRGPDSVPVAFYSFPIFFLFSFLFSFDFWFENFYKTSNLIQTSFCKL
jgi:hypothetical protein